MTESELNESDVAHAEQSRCKGVAEGVWVYVVAKRFHGEAMESDLDRACSQAGTVGTVQDWLARCDLWGELREAVGVAVQEMLAKVGCERESAWPFVVISRGRDMEQSYSIGEVG
jgi:hypothetical protein